MNGEALKQIRRHHLNSDLKQLPLCLYCSNRTAVNMRKIADELKKYVA